MHSKAHDIYPVRTKLFFSSTDHDHVVLIVNVVDMDVEQNGSIEYNWVLKVVLWKKNNDFKTTHIDTRE